MKIVCDFLQLQRSKQNIRPVLKWCFHNNFLRVRLQTDSLFVTCLKAKLPNGG